MVVEHNTVEWIEMKGDLWAGQWNVGGCSADLRGERRRGRSEEPEKPSQAQASLPTPANVHCFADISRPF